jgi:hypothetical protein
LLPSLVKYLSRRFFLLLLAFAGVAGSVTVFADQPNPGRGDGDADWIAQRRERMRNFRQDMQRQFPEDVGRAQGAQPEDPRLRRPPEMDRNPAENNDLRGLRRLSPEERQRLRRDVRDAAREAYVPR